MNDGFYFVLMQVSFLAKKKKKKKKNYGTMNERWYVILNYHYRVLHR